MRETFAQTATELLDEDLSVAVVLADISEQYFDETAQRHPDRLVNVGIREQLLVNVGAGLALSGMRPIVHTIAPFLVERAFEQIKLGFNHQGVGGVLVSVGGSFDNSSSGRTHQAPGDVALLDTLEGWDIHVPGHPTELEAHLRESVAGDGKAYVRVTSQTNREPMPPRGMHVVRHGRRGSVVAVGPTLDRALEATEGLDVTVLYTATVRPFDGQALASTLTEPNVVLIEPYVVGTSAWQVSAALQSVPHRLLSLGVRRVELRRYGTPDEHGSAHGLDASGMRRSITRFLAG